MGEMRPMMCKREIQEIVPAPFVLWAQDSAQIFLTICLENVNNPDIKVGPSKLYFKGARGSDKKLYEVTLNFFKEVEPNRSKYAIRERIVEFAIEKKESGFWDRLLVENIRYHWLKTDFNKWKDQSEDEEDQEDDKGDHYQPMSRDYSRHIAENMAKGSSLCPLGQMMMGTPASFDTEQPKSIGKVKLDQYDETLPDSDDEPLSDLEE